MVGIQIYSKYMGRKLIHLSVYQLFVRMTTPEEAELLSKGRAVLGNTGSILYFIGTEIQVAAFL